MVYALVDPEEVETEKKGFSKPCEFRLFLASIIGIAGVEVNGDREA